MEIEFDPGKSRRNEIERGFGFDLAGQMDFATASIWLGDRRDYGEFRFLALGLINQRVYSLCFTESRSRIRVISFRKANRREVKKYEQSQTS